MESSSSSDDTDESTMVKNEEYLNTFITTQNSNSKKKRLKTALNQSITENRSEPEPKFSKREYSDDSSSSSELATSSINTVNQTMENVPSKTSKKLLKKKRKKDYDSNSSEEESINMSNSREEVNKEKRHTLNNHDLSVIKHEFNNESDYESSDEVEYTKTNSLEQINLQSIKKEVLSDDVPSSSSDSDSDSKSENHSVTNNRINESVIKNEAQSSSDSGSDSEEDGNLMSFHKSPTTFPVTGSPVKILQDVRLTPKTIKPAKEKLLEMYPGIKQIEIDTEIDISDSEDVHLFRIPKNVDPKQLKHAEVSLEKECKVNLEEKYIITPTTKVPDPTLVISAGPRVLFFKNNIKMERYIKSKGEPNIKVPEKKLVPLPDNIKKRHPLFGSDFKQKIKLSDHVEKKLDEAIANLLKRERKSKKKDKRNKKEDSVEKSEEIFDIFNSQNFLTINERIKKEASDDSAFGSCSSIDKPKGKKKEKQRLSDSNIEYETELCTEKEPKEKTTKKKKRHSNDHSWINVSTIKQEIHDSSDREEVLMSPKKKKKSSAINSTLMSDILRTPQFNPEVSTIVSEPSSSGKKHKKSKKDKTHNQEGNIEKDELISQLLNNLTKELNVSKKIKTEF